MQNKATFFSRERVFFLFVTLMCIFVVYNYILSVGIGIALAYLFEPLIDKITSFFPSKKLWVKWVVSIFVIFVTIIAVLMPIFSLITTAIEELGSVLKALQTDIQTPHFFDQYVKNLVIFLKKFGLDYSVNDIYSKSAELLKNAAYFSASSLGNAAYATPAFMIKSMLAVLTWGLFSVHGKSYRQILLPKIIPWEKERRILGDTVDSVLKALIIANVLVSCIQAIFITLSLGLFGMPRYVLIGFISFFLSFVPIIGTAPVMLGAAVWFYLQGHIASTVGVLVCALVVSVMDNILRPFFMKGGIDLGFFWIFLAIVGGISQFGVAGAVLGPVFFALFIAATKMLESHKIVEKKE